MNLTAYIIIVASVGMTLWEAAVNAIAGNADLIESVDGNVSAPPFLSE